MRIQLDWFDERLSERATAVAAGQLVPAVPRDAATVMVLRPSGRPADGVEVLMLRRPAAMAFAPGAYVFPGGSVDPEDYDPGIGWTGPAPEEFGAWLGAAPGEARALVCAAVRETFEESGVLLAGAEDGSLAAYDEASFAADRAALAAGRLTFAGMLARRGLVIRADLLTPWARWITPEAEPRRFDARFFAAALPDGQRAVGDRAEADRIAWLRPAAALDAARSGEMLLLPPTATTLSEFAACGGIAQILASRRLITPVLPRLVVEGGEAWLVIPDEAGYPLLGVSLYQRDETRFAMSIDGSGTERARCVLAPNPSPMTLDGTNTWVIAEPGSAAAVVVDPGPLDEGHLRRAYDVACAGDRRVALIVLTHGHPDHAEGAAEFAAMTGAPVLALDPAHRLGSEGLAAGDVLTAAGCDVRVVETPGHSADSVSLLLEADSALLTGDTVLGRGTTVIAQDGGLGDYLRTLDELRSLAGAAGLRVLLPGHGPVLTDPAGVLDYYIAHRQERLDQIRAALAAGARTPAEIVAIVYADTDPAVHDAAEWSVRAQLDYLDHRNGR